MLLSGTTIAAGLAFPRGGDRVGAVSDRSGVVATRRAALGGALAGVLGVAACDLDKPAPAPSPTSGGTAEPGPQPDSDQQIVDEARAETATLLALLLATATRHGALRRPLAGLRSMHRAHLALLEGGDDPGGAPEPVPATPAAALAALRRSESRAQARLADWSVAADSGALARLLAGMSASVAQHLAVLPTTPGGQA